MDDVVGWIDRSGAIIVAATSVALAVVVSCHAVLTRRDGHSAIGWVGLVWLVPLLGAVLYVAFGINRIGRRATAIRWRRGVSWRWLRSGFADGEPAPTATVPIPTATAAVHDLAPAALVEMDPLVILGGRLNHTPLVRGDRATPLHNGDEAYPEMLAAIAAAEHTVALASYIFDHDTVGLTFVAALIAAHERGVAVRVLIDAVGARYSWPRTATVELLAARGVAARRFNPTRSPIRLRYLNLRSHRKLLIVDGRLAFTGGMNIRADCVLAQPTTHPTRDLHFRLEGPVVTQLMRVFAEDWHFTTRENLVGAAWWPAQTAIGEARARAIVDGPDEDFDKLRRIILGAICVARRRICIITPYFLPDPDIIAALDVAVLRGVRVDILLPATSNLTLVQWAMSHALWRVLQCSCRVWLSPPPFDHSKLMVVDERWLLLGSGNWDPRSLRLNFELNVELHDAELAATLTNSFDKQLQAATPLTHADLAAMPLWARIRNGFAALGAPYL